MTPGEHNVRKQVLTDPEMRVVPLTWRSVIQELDTECPPKPTGVVRMALASPPLTRVPPRVVRHRRMRVTWGWQEVAALAAIALIVIVLIALLRQPIVTGR